MRHSGRLSRGQVYPAQVWTCRCEWGTIVTPSHMVYQTCLAEVARVKPALSTMLSIDQSLISGAVLLSPAHVKVLPI